jgi:hypothetical protein
MTDAEEFVKRMLESAADKKKTQSQSRTGNVDQKTAEENLKLIQERLRKQKR